MGKLLPERIVPALSIMHICLHAVLYLDVLFCLDNDGNL